MELASFGIVGALSLVVDVEGLAGVSLLLISALTACHLATFFYSSAGLNASPLRRLIEDSALLLQIAHLL